MSRVAIATGIGVILALQITYGQAPSTTRRSPSAPASVTLPVRRVVLYKNGVAYVEHIGKVRDNQSVVVDLTSGQLDDVLNSMTVLDLGNGRIGGISYNSEAPIGQRLGELHLPSGNQTDFLTFLEALRGARLEVRSATGVFAGRLLGTERHSAQTGSNAPAADRLTLVSDSGDIRTVELTPSIRIKVLDKDSADQMTAYLGLLTSTRSPDRRRMTIATSGAGERDVALGYVTEAPIWKTSYRVVFPPDGEQPFLQGWAIVDNTSTEDWTNVDLSLIAGAPQSFIQQISQPRYARRPVIQSPQALSFTPQTHDPTLTVGSARLRGVVRDASGAGLPGVAVRVLDQQRRTVAQATADRAGAYTIANLAPGTYRVEFALPGFATTAAGVTIAADREALQNVEMRVGTQEETVTISGESTAARGGIAGGFSAGVGGGTGGGIYMPGAPAAQSARIDQQPPAASSQELADVFEYRVNAPITIPRNQSALIPIINTPVAVERVSLWNGRSGTQPLRALWLTNTTGLTLDSGSFTVLDAGIFGGEGLLEPLRPQEQRLISYGADLGVQVESHQGDAQQTTSRIVIDHGILIEHHEQRARRVYTIRNNDTSDRLLVIEHPVRPGWALAEGLHPAETSTAAYRFKIAAPARQTKTMAIDETQPLQDRYEIAVLSDDQVKVILRGAGGQALQQALAPIIGKKATIASMSGDLDRRELEIQASAMDQQRIRENLTAVRNSGGNRQLANRYASELSTSEDQLTALRQQSAVVRQTLEAARAELAQLIEALALDVAAGS